MEIIKSYLREKGIFPKVKLDDKKPHTFEFLKAKIVEYEDGSSSLKVLVKEEGELKTISSPSVLVEIQDCEPGDVYKVQLRYRTIGGRPFRDYEVEKIKSGGKKETTKEAGQEEIADEPMTTDEEPEKAKDDGIPVVEDEGTSPTEEELQELFPEHKED